MKTAFVFPGQGAQYVGMGADLAAVYREARETFEEADTALGFSLSELCFHGPDELLQHTPITQPAILTASVACWRVLRRYGWDADVVAGLSLGEYTALVAAGALSFRDAVVLVHKRGQLMSEAVPPGEGSMAAVIGLDREEVVAACRRVSQSLAENGAAHAVVEAVNFNCPGQVVIAGHAGAVSAAAELLRERGARRVVPLAVSGPFHSSLMKPAAARFAEELEKVEICDPTVPVVSNVSGNYVCDAAAVREALVRQVASPVLWEDGIRRMIADGVSRFVEVGPGTVLSGFLKNIIRPQRSASVGKAVLDGPSAAGGIRAVSGFNVQDIPSLERLLDLRGEVC